MDGDDGLRINSLRNKAVISPLSIPFPSPSHETWELLEKKLATAEQDTRALIDRLGCSHKQVPDMLLPDTSQSDSNTLSVLSDAALCNVRPIVGCGQAQLEQSTSSDLSQNYDALVSRMCKTESVIKTLKHNLYSLSQPPDGAESTDPSKATICRKHREEYEHKTTTLVQVYEAKLSSLRRELRCVKEDLSQEQVSKKDMLDRLMVFQDEVSSYQTSKAQSDVCLEGAEETRQKLEKRLSTLREELSREICLRSSVEASHASLLARIRDMDISVETERLQVDNLTRSSESIKLKCRRAIEDLQEEQTLRKAAEFTAVQLTQEYSAKEKLLTESMEERKSLAAELSRLTHQYSDLLQQLATMETLMTEQKDIHENVQSKRTVLKQTMDKLVQERENERLDYQRKLALEQGRVQDKRRTDDENERLRKTVHGLEVEKDKALQTQDELKNQLLEQQSLQTATEHQFKQAVMRLEQEVNSLKRDLATAELQRHDVLNERQNLMKQVNEQVDGVMDEKNRLEYQLEKVRTEYSVMFQTKEGLEKDKLYLLEQVSELSQKMKTHDKLGLTLKSLTDEKNSLAYDKGVLENCVEQLNKQHSDWTTAQGPEIIKLQKLNTSIQEKYKKSHKAVSDLKVKLQRSDNQVIQLKQTAEQQEKDFTLALHARDEATRESGILQEKLRQAEEKEMIKLEECQKNLDNTKANSHELTSTLDSLMTSHTQLQTAVASLQTDLGRRDSRINQLATEKSDLEQELSALQQEAAAVQERLITIEEQDISEITGLRKSLEQCRGDNGKLALSLEEVISSNSDLQSSLQRLQNDYTSVKKQIADLRQCREKEQSEYKKQLHNYKENFESLEKELKDTKTSSSKKVNKDVAELRKQNESLINKTGELSRANGELRQKAMNIEQANKILQDKLTRQKTQYDNVCRSKKDLQEHIVKLKNVKEELDDLEHVRNEYVKKNKAQAQSIALLVSQIASMQSELKLLAHVHRETETIIKEQEKELQRERLERESMAKKYQDAKKNKNKVEKERQEAHSHIHDINNESIEQIKAATENLVKYSHKYIAHHLQEAHTWFRDKYDVLQEQLQLSRTSQAVLEHENHLQREELEKEQQRAQAAAHRARELIKSSEVTTGASRVGDQLPKQINGDVLPQSHDQMMMLSQRLQQERDHNKYLEAKHQKFKHSSMRHIEKLAKELSHSKSAEYG